MYMMLRSWVFLFIEFHGELSVENMIELLAAKIIEEKKEVSELQSNLLPIAN